jgi:hypothetical protein
VLLCALLDLRRALGKFFVTVLVTGLPGALGRYLIIMEAPPHDLGILFPAI